MNTENLFDAFEFINNNYKEEVFEMMNRKRALRKIVRLTLIAAAVMCLLTATAYGAGSIINSPAAAEEVAVQELERWQELGLLSEEVSFEGKAEFVREQEEEVGDEYWFNRIFPHSYTVRWYADQEGEKYFVNVYVDTAQGKITHLNVEAEADPETDELIEERETEVSVGPDPEVTEMQTWRYYENFDDIFPADVTVGEYCERLAEYWGFEGYTIADTEDDFYGKFEAPSADTLLKDTCDGDFYITVFFEGDQESTPRYIQLSRFPGRSNITVGMHHIVG